MIICFVPDKTAVCIGFGSWSARVAQPSAAFVEKEFCEQARRNRRGLAPRFCHTCCRPRDAAHNEQRNVPRARVPRRRPTHGSTRQDAECRARRPSRLVQRKTDGVTPLADVSCRKTSLVAASGAPPVRSHVDASCG